jgi:hypothetical protein
MLWLEAPMLAATTVIQSTELVAENAKALTQAGIEASLFGEAAEGGRNA